MIVVDTGGLLALLDRDDRHHERVRACLEEDGDRWVIPWAVLPEVDHLATTRLGARVAQAFLEDLNEGLFRVDSHFNRDLPRAMALLRRYGSLHLGLVDAVVMAQAERHEASAVVTLDAKHFRAVRLSHRPRLIPLDD